MLSPSDIRPAVREVLLSTGNSLASYQILDRLPAELRDQIIAERGMPGAGQGSPYTAASLVTDAVEGLLPSMDAPYRVYLEMGDMTFEVAGQIIKPGNPDIAFYKLPAPETPPSSTAFEAFGLTSHVPHTVLPQQMLRPQQSPPNYAAVGEPNKPAWYDRNGLLVLWLFLFWPVALYGFIRSTKISKTAKYVTLGVFILISAINAATNPRHSVGASGQTVSAASDFSAPEADTLVQSAPVRKEKTWRKVKQFTGDGIKNTETFEISGDEWRIRWDTKGRGGPFGNMNFQIYVYNADGSLKDLAANVIGKNSDSTVIRGAGHYYLQFNTAQPYEVVVEEYR